MIAEPWEASAVSEAEREAFIRLSDAFQGRASAWNAAEYPGLGQV